MEKLKEFYANAFLTFCAGWILFHLILIGMFEAVLITEPNKWILWAEIVMVSLIVLLGIERLVKDLIRYRRK